MGTCPATLQTCRSLLQFLDKKLETTVSTPPELSLPEWTQALPDIKDRVEKYAELKCRFEGLKLASWDARAKRVLNIAETVSSERGQQAMEEQNKKLQAMADELAKLLSREDDTPGME